MVHIKRKNEKEVPVLMQAPGAVPLFRFPALDAVDGIRYGFSTRLGGVSGTKSGEEHLSSLNLSFSRGDADENVRENFRRLADTLEVSFDRFVFTDQTHTTNVRVVTAADAGKGLCILRDYTDVDALVTDVPGLVLSIFVADCVPILIVDPVRRAVGAAHSGWRGTVGRIGKKTIQAMVDTYGSNPEDLRCVIGPSICQDCYEVSEDVAEQFASEFSGHEDEILINKYNGHYQLDLWEANRIILTEAGVRPEYMEVTDVCTCCNPDLLYSHRASKGKRGNLGAFISVFE